MNIISLLFLLLVTLARGGEDFYKTLGVSRTATDKELKRAYHKLAMKWHPDKNKEDPNAEKKFVAINNAYEILSDPEKRKQYDQFGEDAFKPGGGQQQPPPHFHQGGGGGGGSRFENFQYSNANDFFARFMNGMGGGGGGNPFFNMGGGFGSGNGGFGGGGGGQRGRGGRAPKPLYVNARNVIALTGKNWQSEGPGDKREVPWAVHFYDPANCPDCEVVEVNWQKVAKELHGLVKFGAVNCGATPRLCAKMSVASPPSFQVFPVSGSPRTFKEPKTEVKALYDFVLHSCSSIMHKLNTVRLDKLLALKCDATESRESKKTQKSSEKPKQKVEIVLMSDRKDPSSALIRAALKHRKVNFSQGSITDRKTVEALLRAANQAETKLSKPTLFVVHPPKTKGNPKEVTSVQMVAAKPSKEALESLLLTLGT